MSPRSFLFFPAPVGIVAVYYCLKSILACYHNVRVVDFQLLFSNRITITYSLTIFEKKTKQNGQTLKQFVGNSRRIV